MGSEDRTYLDHLRKAAKEYEGEVSPSIISRFTAEDRGLDELCAVTKREKPTLAQMYSSKTSRMLFGRLGL